MCLETENISNMPILRAALFLSLALAFGGTAQADDAGRHYFRYKAPLAAAGDLHDEEDRD